MVPKYYALRLYKNSAIVRFENRVPDSYMSFATKKDAYAAAMHANGQCNKDCFYCKSKVAPCWEALVSFTYPAQYIEPFASRPVSIINPAFLRRAQKPAFFDPDETQEIPHIYKSVEVIQDTLNANRKG